VAYFKVNITFTFTIIFDKAFPPTLFYQYINIGYTSFSFTIRVISGGTQWRIWLRHCATNRKVAGSIPDGVNEIFIDIILLAALWPWG
jgi:hypothetical protein